MNESRIPETYILLLNYNGWKDTLICLDSLSKLTARDFSVIVIDNASSDDSRQKIPEWISQHGREKFLLQPVWIENNHNWGFAGGLNAGVDYIKDKQGWKYVWMLNNDTTADEGSLTALIYTTVKEQLGICGSTLLLSESGQIQALGGSIHKKFGTTRFIRNEKDLHALSYVVGTSFFLTRECLETVGKLPEEYFLYYEEVDYCFRAKQLGFKLGCSLDSVVHHALGAATGSSLDHRKVSFFSDCLIVRNRILFAHKYLGSWTWIYLGLMISCINRFRRGQFSRVWCILKITFSRKAFSLYINKKI
jgi:GT2 family glycosyltransferase